MKFPNTMSIEMKYSPPEAFGTSKDYSRLTIRDHKAELLLNANTGRIRILSTPHLEPVHAVIEWPEQRFELKGDIFRYEASCKDEKELEEHLITFFYIFPAMLNVYFADPPTVLSTEGYIGKTSFRWEQVATQFIMNPVTPEEIEKNIQKAFLDLESLSRTNNRRLAAAARYFYTASRLIVAGNSDWEFMSEVILNLCKVLQILFGNSMDDVRKGLTKLCYAEDEREGDFIPLMILRNSIDVGHPLLKIFTQQQLDIFYIYLGHVENLFRDLFKRLFERIKDGSFKLNQIEDLEFNSDQRKTINRLIDTITNRINTSGIKRLLTEI